MKFRQTNTPTRASAKAAFSPSSGYRLEHDPRLPSQKHVKRGRRRPDPLATIWESEIVPMLRAVPAQNCELSREIEEFQAPPPYRRGA
jgi:hypothetical protein